MKKIFLICLAILLCVQGTASAEDKGLPESERIKIALEVTDGSRHKSLNTAQSLETFLAAKLAEKNLVNIVEAETLNTPYENDLIRDEEVTADSPENFGELMIFDAVELPGAVETPENFDQNFYTELGASYVVRCEVLALGATKVEDSTIGTITGIIGSGLSYAGDGSNSNRNKTLRRVGDGISMFSFIQTKRTALNTVVNMQFISVETGQILWQGNFTGQAVKHHKSGQNYSDPWQEAYIKSVEESAKLIAKRVNKYVDKVLIQGKSDKDFAGKKFSFGNNGVGGLLSF